MTRAELSWQVVQGVRTLCVEAYPPGGGSVALFGKPAADFLKTVLLDAWENDLHEAAKEMGG